MKPIHTLSIIKDTNSQNKEKIKSIINKGAGIIKRGTVKKILHGVPQK